MITRIHDATSGLVIRGLNKSYGQDDATQLVLNDLELMVRSGELVTIIGASGAGKTTLLRVLAGLESYEQGTVLFNGATLEPGDISYVFQKPILYPHLNVRENILFGTRLKISPKADENLYRFLMSALRISELEKRRPSELSGGQAQRVGIARALVRKSPVVFFDEPLSSVDEEMSSGIREDLLNLHRQLGFTGLYITHNQNEAFYLGERVAVLSNGRIEQLSSAQEIFSNPKNLSVARLTGYPHLNEIEHQGVTAAIRATSLHENESVNQTAVRVHSTRLTLDGKLVCGVVLEATNWTTHGGGSVAIPVGQELTWLSTHQAVCERDEVVRLGVRPENIHVLSD